MENRVSPISIPHPVFRINSLLNERLNDLENAYKILTSLVTAENQTKIDIAHIQKTFASSYSSISFSLDALRTISNKILSGDKERESGEKPIVFSKILDEFMDVLIQFVLSGVFQLKSVAQYLVFISNFHLLLFKTIINPNKPLDQEKFKEAWNNLYTCISKFRVLNQDIDYGGFSIKFKGFLQAIRNIKTQESLHQISIESIESLIKYLNVLSESKNPSKAELNNLLMSLQQFSIEFNQLLTNFNQMEKHDFLYESTQIVQNTNNLTFLVKSSLAAFNIEKLASNIQSFVMKGDVYINFNYFNNPEKLYDIANQTLNLLLYEQHVITIFDNDSNAYSLQKMQQATKNVSNALKQHNLSADTTKDFFKLTGENCMLNIPKNILINYIKKGEVIFSQYLMHNNNHSEEIKKGTKYWDDFKSFKSARINSENCSSGIWNLLAYSYYYNIFHDTNDNYYNNFVSETNDLKSTLFLQYFITHIHDTSLCLSAILPKLINDMSYDEFHNQSNEIRETLTTLLELHMKWMGNQHFCEYNHQYIRLIEVLIHTCSIICDISYNQNVGSAISEMFYLFPHPSCLMEALHIEEMSVVVQDALKSILSSNIKDISATQKFGLEVDSKISREEIKYAFVDQELSLKKISDLSEKLYENILRVKFYVLYSTFFEQYCSPKNHNPQMKIEKISKEFFTKVDFLIGAINSVISQPTIKFYANPELFSIMLEIIKCLITNDEVMAKEMSLKVTKLIPHLDFSEILEKNCLAIEKIGYEIILLEDQYPNKIKEIKDMYRLYKVAEASLMTWIVSGKHEEFHNPIKDLLICADNFNPNFGQHLHAKFEEIYFLGGHIKAISDLINIVEMTIGDDKPTHEIIQKLNVNLILKCFLLNIMSAFAIEAQDLASHQLILSDAVIDFKNCLNIMIQERECAFQEITTKNVQDLSSSYFALRDLLQIKPVEIMMDKVPHLFNSLAASISITEIGITDEMNKLFYNANKTMQKSLIETEPNRQAACFIKLKGIVKNLERVVSNEDNGNINHNIKNLYSELDYIVMFMHIQSAAFICDLLLARLCGPFRIYVPEFNMEPIIPPDKSKNEKKDFPPVSEFISSMKHLKDLLNHLVRISRGNESLMSTVKILYDEVNSAFRLSSGKFLFEDAEIQKEMDASKKLLADFDQSKSKLTKELKKLERIEKENREIRSRVIARFEGKEKMLEERENTKLSLEEKIVLAGSDLSNIKAKTAEYSRLLSRYNKFKDKASSMTVETKQEIQQRSSEMTHGNHSLVEISQRLTLLMDENERIRKEIKEARSSIDNESLDYLQEEVKALEKRKEELQKEMNNSKPEAISANEENAKSNDEELFDIFDRIREDVANKKKFDKESVKITSELMSKVFNAISFSSEQLEAAKKLNAVKKKAKKMKN